jgi:hypothetical protein
MDYQHLFERQLAVSREEIEFQFRCFAAGLPWADYLLNPRRLRGSDFLMRWSQGVWSENRLLEALNRSSNYYAIPYGPSGVAPDDDPRAFELYFERLEAAGLRSMKRPDLLVFPRSEQHYVDSFVSSVGGLTELPFISEEKLRPVLSRTVIAVECENSLWIAKKMPKFGIPLSPQKRLGGKLGVPKTAVLPTVIIKNEDLSPLTRWEEQNGIPIHIWHVFFDMAFGIALDRACQLFAEGLIQPTAQTFQAPSGATSVKQIFKIYYHYAYELGTAVSAPALEPAYIEDKNGHILPYVKFDGGRLELADEVIHILDALKTERLGAATNG